MLKIKKTEISLTRGDSAYITLNITDGEGNPIEITPQDTIRCQVRKSVNDGELLFEGEIIREVNEDETISYIWHINPSDTDGADVSISYVWDAQIEFENGDIFTFIPVSAFNILDEVTMVG